MKKRVAGLVLAGVATTGLGLGATVAAVAEPTATPTPGSSTSADRGSTPAQSDRGPGRHGRMDGELAKQLAEKLGVDQAGVTQALMEIRTSHQAERTREFRATLDRAVTDGKLTRAEADAVVKAAEAGVIGMGGRQR